jgi:predicted HTH domain antitoxin
MQLVMGPELTARAGLSESELLVELAVLLYERDKLTLGHAARLAGMDKWAFNDLLAEREIPMHYDLKEWEQDLATIRGFAIR